MLQLLTRKLRSASEVITTQKTTERKDFLPVVHIIKLSHEELKDQASSAGCAQVFAPDTRQHVGCPGACLYIAMQQEETLDLILIISTANSEVQKWL